MAVVACGLGQLEILRKYIYIYIWYRIIRYMLYCICAFFKCILEVCDVVHDILPYPFRMHDKNQPKVNIPSAMV